jgi:hypothetical protein
MIYLASPYSHKDPAVREMRFVAACKQAAEMLRCDIPVYSPIVHSHPIAIYGGIDPMDGEFWARADRPYLELCDEVWVLTLPGWEESKGVHIEIERAEELGMKILYVEPEERWL